MLVSTVADNAAGQAANQPRIVDTNVSLFQWPFRRLPLDDPDKLVNKLRALGIAQAWVGSFEGLLHRDLAAVNQRLAAVCADRTVLTPIGSINPEMPGWQDDLRRCIEEHNMPGVRLHPNYHGYSLDDKRFGLLLETAASAGRFVQLAALMEDTRTQHPAMQKPDVDLAPLVRWMRAVPGARVQLLNYRPRTPLVDQLAEIPGIFFDTARVEGADGVPALVQRVSPSRVMFGTHAPFLIPEAALIRVHESGKLDLEQITALLSGNASAFLQRASG
jgi:predicted TIM-barrel fold metal-dependent hydrolase